MSWSQMQSLFDGQGMVFWAAVTAVALGLTMLSVSIVFQVRKMLGRVTGPGRRARDRGPQVQAPVPTVPRVTVTSDGYRAAGFVPPRPATPAAEDMLNSLLERLRVSADRLERMHRSLGDSPGPSVRVQDSLLKDPSDEVDYVYQAGRA